MTATRNILITGPTNGKETALALAAQGHKLFLLCRNEQVRAAAERFLARNEPLHILINNAGVVNTQRITVDVEGTEQGALS